MEAIGPDAAAGKLLAEIRQTRPFRSVAEESMLGLLRTADEVQRRLAAVVEPDGLSVQQYNVLRILRGAGAKGLPTLDIAGRMIERTPGITRLLDKLEVKGLVSRSRGPLDRRQVVCRITASGLALLVRLDDPMTIAGIRAMAALDEIEQRVLIGLLDRLRSGPESPTEL